MKKKKMMIQTFGIFYEDKHRNFQLILLTKQIIITIITKQEEMKKKSNEKKKEINSFMF